MVKIKAVQWIGLIPFFISITLLGIVWYFTGFNKIIFYILALIIFTVMYFSTHLFFYNLFEWGENKITDDKELIILEKEETSLWWMYVSGAGFTFLAGGIPVFDKYPHIAIIGLIFLIIGNLIYNVLYYPRYRLLYRKRLIQRELNNI